MDPAFSASRAGRRDDQALGAPSRTRRTEVLAEAAEGDVEVGGRRPRVGCAVLGVLLARQPRVQHAAGAHHSSTITSAIQCYHHCSITGLVQRRCEQQLKVPTETHEQRWHLSAVPAIAVGSSPGLAKVQTHDMGWKSQKADICGIFMLGTL